MATQAVLEAGGVVRWLLRKNASTLLPGNGIVGRHASAFEAAWALAIPHAEFTPT